MQEKWLEIVSMIFAWSLIDQHEENWYFSMDAVRNITEPGIEIFSSHVTSEKYFHLCFSIIFHVDYKTTVISPNQDNDDYTMGLSQASSHTA